jgi:tetratricopeptide (TPR) repeat protein
VAAQLPVASAPLPVVSTGLPVARGFGEINLPIVAETLPAMTSGDRHLPSVSGRTQAGLGSFGEIELPRELSAGATIAGLGPDAGSQPQSGRNSSGDYQDLQLEDKPRARGRSSSSGQPSAPDAGGMTFGEVDFSSGQGDSVGSDSALSVVAPLPRPDEPMAISGNALGGEVALSAPARTAVARALPRATGGSAAAAASTGTKVGLAAGVAVLIGGAALQLTPYGAFGFVLIADKIHAKDFATALSTTAAATEKGLGADTYDAAKAAVDAAAAAHDRMPRARGLTAYASLVEAATTVRFGPDTARASRAKQLLAEVPADAVVEYRGVALAAQAAANDDAAGARKALDAVGKGGELPVPARLEAALLRGNVSLGQHAAGDAEAAFKEALALSDDARAHYGLAQAYDQLHDAANVKKEIDATLAASPGHPGALTLRAAFEATTEEAQAEKDLGMVLDGPSRGKASTRELSAAFVVRAAVSLRQDNPGQAREDLDHATKLDPRNVAALLGEGKLLLDQGRSTEALARFDTALQIDPGRPEVIAFDAAAKIALDRLADAKLQLTDGHARFPKDVLILTFLGAAEHHLGNEEAAEADLRSAMALVSPTDLDAVGPYIALSQILSSRGRLDDAKAVLEEAKRNLPPSAVLDRAIGEVAEQQGNYDLAIAQYHAALQRAPRDLASHFRLAVAMRRLRRFPEAGAELDKVAKVDADYPGLSLERGLLFQESGDVEKAIAEFQRALAKAPDDPDLQLRVGSAYVSVGLPDNAIPMLRKVVQERPKSAEAYHFLGRALMLKGPSQQAEAMRTLKYAVDLDPNRAEFHVYLAWAANEATPAQLELAHDEIDKALALDKLNAEVYWQKGVLEQMEASIDDAIHDEKRALELRPSRYEAHATLAECYSDRNDEAAAMAEWTKALTADGDAPGPDGLLRHPFWRYRFGKLLMDHGNSAGALRWLLPTALGMEKSEQRPAWLMPLEFLTAEALNKAGRRSEAADHYQKFLDGAPVSSPDRAEAQNALRRIGGR